jgi:hypothetical protein
MRTTLIIEDLRVVRDAEQSIDRRGDVCGRYRIAAGISGLLVRRPIDQSRWNTGTGELN